MDLVQTANKNYWRNFGIICVVSMPVTPRVSWSEFVFTFYKTFSTFTKKLF